MGKEATLFERLGGVPALRAAVDEFYKRLLDDPKLSVMFEDVRMPLLKTHQLAFMKIAFSKIPDDLDVPKLIFKKHMRLFLRKGLNESHFDLVAQHLIQTLQHLNISPPLINEAISIIAPLRAVFEKGGKLKQPADEKKEEEPITVEKVASQSESSLVERLGGTDGLHAVVKGLYERMIDDAELAPFFKNANLAQLKQHQAAFLAIAFKTSPVDVDTVQHIRKSHIRLMQTSGLEEMHFDMMIAHFNEVLAEIGIPEQAINEACSVLEEFRTVFRRHELIEC